MPSAAVQHSARRIRRTEVVDGFGIGLGLPFLGTRQRPASSIRGSNDRLSQSFHPSRGCSDAADSELHPGISSLIDVDVPMSRWRIVVLALAVSAGILAMHGLEPMVGHSASMTPMQHTPLVQLVGDTTVASDHDMTTGAHVGELCRWVLITIGTLAALAVLARRRAQLHASASLGREKPILASGTLLASARAGPMPVLLC
jgi:hypothetical protein